MRFNDRTFKSIFIFLVTLSFALMAILLLSSLLLIPIKSTSLWMGAGIMVLGINVFMNVRNLAWKIAILTITGLAMTMFLNATLHWGLTQSFYFASGIVVFAVLLHMTFIS